MTASFASDVLQNGDNYAAQLAAGPFSLHDAPPLRASMLPHPSTETRGAACPVLTAEHAKRIASLEKKLATLDKHNAVLTRAATRAHPPSRHHRTSPSEDVAVLSKVQSLARLHADADATMSEAQDDPFLHTMIGYASEQGASSACKSYLLKLTTLAKQLKAMSREVGGLEGACDKAVSVASASSSGHRPLGGRSGSSGSAAALQRQTSRGRSGSGSRAAARTGSSGRGAAAAPPPPPPSSSLSSRRRTNSGGSFAAPTTSSLKRDRDRSAASRSPSPSFRHQLHYSPSAQRAQHQRDIQQLRSATAALATATGGAASGKLLTQKEIKGVTSAYSVAPKKRTASPGALYRAS
eukprot:Rhum_TRINITY_DN14312_c10_g3::Rhum_TRINITY_DN14312_c10_g3_i1::g.79347::m.79347